MRKAKPTGAICPHCQSTHVVRNGFSRIGVQRYECIDCKRQ